MLAPGPHIQMVDGFVSRCISSVQSAIVATIASGSFTPKAKSTSDQASSVPRADEPVTAAPVIRLSARAAVINSSRSRSRYAGVNTGWILVVVPCPLIR
jgi:hypothetical protein